MDGFSEPQKGFYFLAVFIAMIIEKSCQAIM